MQASHNGNVFLAGKQPAACAKSRSRSAAKRRHRFLHVGMVGTLQSCTSETVLRIFHSQALAFGFLALSSSAGLNSSRRANTGSIELLVDSSPDSKPPRITFLRYVRSSPSRLFCRRSSAISCLATAWAVSLHNSTSR